MLRTTAAPTLAAHLISRGHDHLQAGRANEASTLFLEVDYALAVDPPAAANFEAALRHNALLGLREAGHRSKSLEEAIALFDGMMLEEAGCLGTEGLERLAKEWDVDPSSPDTP